MQQGWICPKCNSVYGPFTNECYRCNEPHELEVKIKYPSPLGLDGLNTKLS